MLKQIGMTVALLMIPCTSMAYDTMAPSGSPTASESSMSPSVSVSPSEAPTPKAPEPTFFPTMFPTISVQPSSDPTHLEPTLEPTDEPFSATPTIMPTVTPTKPHHHASIGKIIGKTIGWLILIALSVLFFGAVMSNRYRIYYALRGVWYSILQMSCTRWIMAKLNFRGGAATNQSSLNEIIFNNNELSEGLLMGEQEDP